MPKVPTYDQFTVPLSDAAMPRVTAPDMPIVAGKEALALGEGAMRTARFADQYAEKVRDEANQLRVIDATNEAVKAQLALTYDKDNGFLNFKGKAALERPDNKPLDVEYTEKFENQLAIIEEGLGNEQQKKLFRQASAGLARQFMGSVNSHVAAEYKEYQVGVQNGVIDVATQKMALNWGDPKMVAEQQSLIKAAQAERDKNLSPEQREANLIKALSPGNTAVVSSAVDAGNTTYAKEYLLQNAAYITPENRLVLARAVETGDFEERTQKLAQDIYKEADGDLTKALDIARERLKGKDEDRTIERLKVRFGEADKDIEKRTQGYADQYLEQTKGDYKAAIDLARKDLSGADEDRTVERLKVRQLEVKQETDNTSEERTQKLAEDIYTEAKGDKATALRLARERLQGKDQDKTIERLKVRFAEDKEPVDPTKVQTETERILAASKGDVKAALALARQELEGELENSVVQKITQMDTENVALRERRQREAKEAGFAAYNKVGSFYKIPPTVLAAMDPTDVANLKQFAENRAYTLTARGEAEERRRNEKLYRTAAPEFLALYSNIDKLETMTTTDILALEPRLGPQHTESLLKRREQIENREGKLTARIDDDQFKAIANEYGLNPYNKPTKKQREVLGLVQSRVDMMLEDAVKKKRQPLTKEEKARIMRDAMKQEVEIDGLIWNDTKAAITLTPQEEAKVVVPPADRKQIVQALQEAYKASKSPEYAPTEENIRRLYIKGLRK